MTGAVLTEAMNDPRLPDLRRASPRPQSGDVDDYLTLAQVAEATGVAEHYLRKRALAGLLGTIEHKNLSRTGHASLVVPHTVLNAEDPKAGTDALPAEWIARHQADLLLMSEAAEARGFAPLGDPEGRP
ncbi:hypothetical protein JK386_04915 [Nocardioides sp. zg-536]|uniref:Uncharacterized protein n=1 Tax=Nocardioides faecalis TaxID=2803858 RepID=A0A939BS37_9ACTN|nr:hypothetical protein [Nocardioides faecalis]MBM9459234.1 hypothetical protein [Nocardioides faecalis]QVI59631.1 hypothetical protein KG111_04600 [Nocardioides faecalis]